MLLLVCGFPGADSYLYVPSAYLVAAALLPVIACEFLCGDAPISVPKGRFLCVPQLAKCLLNKPSMDLRPTHRSKASDGSGNIWCNTFDN